LLLDSKFDKIRVVPDTVARRLADELAKKSRELVSGIFWFPEELGDDRKSDPCY
jgi:hypothetical protein